MELDSRKKSKRDRMMCLNSFETQEMREIGRKEAGESRGKRTNETPQGTWLSGAQRGSLWLCYAGPLAEKWKSGISGKRHRPKPIPWENSLES